MRDQRPATPCDADRAHRERLDRELFHRHLHDGDRRAREQLVERFLPLARSVALRYQTPRESLEDLVQVASLALVKAIDRYEPARGCAFSSFAVPTIVGELKCHFRDRTWAVRPPRDLLELSLRVERAGRALEVELGRAPTIAELAQALDRREEDVLEAVQSRRGRSALSFQAPRGTDEDIGVFGDLLGADDDGFEQAERRALLDMMLKSLSAREAEVVRLRFHEDMTQAEIGAILGVSQMQVSRIVRHAVERLRLVAKARDVHVAL